MANRRETVEERQTRLDAMIDEFRAARQRRLVKQGIALWNRSEKMYRSGPSLKKPPEKIN